MRKESMFVKILGNSSKARVIDYLITCRGLPVHQSDVMRNSNVSKVTVSKVWSGLIKEKALEYDRTIGKAKLYRLNLKNSVIKKLIELYNICLEKEAEFGLNKEKMIISA